MLIKRLKLTSFRSYARMEQDFAEGVNFIVGPNATGKTNLLEALRYLSVGRSFRARKDQDLIRWGDDFARLEAELEKNKIEFYFDQGARKIKIGGVEKRINDLWGIFPSVIFKPNDLELLMAEPGERRRFLDLILCQVDKNYLRAFLELKKVLLNRNELLWLIRERGAREEELDFWDEKMVELDQKIKKQRQALIDFCNEKIEKIYGQMAGKNDCKLILSFQPSYFSKEKRREEIRKGRSLTGPQRDDWEILLEQKSLERFGSRGEIRGTVLALKKIEMLYLEAQLKQKPVLLLDDVFSELDTERRNFLGMVLEGQVFITATNLDKINFAGKVIKVGDLK